MTTFESYRDKYENIAFERGEGVLLVRLHTAGKELVFSEQLHHDLPLAFVDIAGDPGNKVVILTGTGNRFCTTFDGGSFAAHAMKDPAESRLRIRSDGVRMLTACIDIEVPVIAAINGPAVVHAEIAMLADVVLASEETVLQDSMHFAIGQVPGDGVHTIWTNLLGTNRGRYFLMTGQVISAQEALDLGLVSEVMPAGDLLARAHELAAKWAGFPRATLVGTRQVMTGELRRLLREQLRSGLTEQGLASALSALPVPSGGGEFDPSSIPPMEMWPHLSLEAPAERTDSEQEDVKCP